MYSNQQMHKINTYITSYLSQNNRSKTTLIIRKRESRNTPYVVMSLLPLILPSEPKIVKKREVGIRKYSTKDRYLNLPMRFGKWSLYVFEDKNHTQTIIFHKCSQNHDHIYK